MASRPPPSCREPPPTCTACAAYAGVHVDAPKPGTKNCSSTPAAPPPVGDVTPLPGVAPKTPPASCWGYRFCFFLRQQQQQQTGCRTQHGLNALAKTSHSAPLQKRTISYNTTIGARPRGNTRTRRSEISVEIEFYDPTQPWRSCAV